tara:strand:+ start:2356 stop:2769 length:414 start_codon:yes stop_codon:yes gene_type:complete
MNTAILLIILVPILEIYLFIKIGSEIGAFLTISMIFVTAILGLLYARIEGFNTLRSGMQKIIENKVPLYEIISGAALAIAAFLLIFPGFATDLLGLMLVIPTTRKLILYKFSKKYSKNKKTGSDKEYIDGESEEIDN